jgi:serine/threonine protein kinase
MIGELVGGYRLTKKLGEGGTGETFLAAHAQSAHEVAVKVLFPQMCKDAALVERFFADVKVASLVNHSGIADLIDCGVLPAGRAFVITEYLQGKTLTDALIELGQVSDVASLADIAWQIATMLRAAHEASIIHGALKPDAIFLTFPPGQAPRPLVKLVDFGMARFRLGIRHSQTGSLLGAPLYMSPEVGRGVSKVDQRADIYSLGCIMFEMACGRPPFVREGQGELIIAHATEPAPFVSAFEPKIPQAIDQLIGRMLTKNPMTRPQSMTEVATILERFFECPTPVAEHITPAPPIFPQAQAPSPVFAPAPPVLVAPAVQPPREVTPPVRQPKQASSVVPSPPASDSGPQARRNTDATAILAPGPKTVPPAPLSATAFLSPTDEQNPGTGTAVLPQGPSWLGKVRQQTAINPRSTPRSVVRPSESHKERPSRPTGRSTPSAMARSSSSRPTVAKRGLFDGVNLPIVVVSAAILLVVAAVVLLVLRRSEVSPAQTDSAARPRASTPAQHEYLFKPPAPAATVEPAAQPDPQPGPGNEHGAADDGVSAKGPGVGGTPPKDKDHPKRFW